jgi:hypothetical protein
MTNNDIELISEETSSMPNTVFPVRSLKDKSKARKHVFGVMYYEKEERFTVMEVYGH